MARTQSVEANVLMMNVVVVVVKVGQNVIVVSIMAGLNVIAVVVRD